MEGADPVNTNAARDGIHPAGAPSSALSFSAAFQGLFLRFSRTFPLHFKEKD